MVGAKLGFPELERLLVERQGRSSLPAVLICRREVAMLASVSG